MREQFIDGFMADLNGEVPDEYLRTIRNKLALYVNDFDISQRETAVVKYTGYLPDFYKAYIVSRKIEGLSKNTLELYNLYLDDFFFTVNKDVKDITANDIRVYLYTTQENRNISNRTLDSSSTAIHDFFEWATNKGYRDCGWRTGRG